MANRLGFGARVRMVAASGESILAIHGIVAHRCGAHHVKIRCPSHSPDTTPSCSVNLANGRAHCFGCAFRAGDVVALHRTLGGFASMGDALRDLERRSGLPMPRLELRPAPPTRRGDKAPSTGTPIEVRRWSYETADGSPAFDVVRLQFRLADGSWQIDPEKQKPSKEYRPASPGSSRWAMPEPYAGGAPRPLFNLPAILAADPRTVVYVVEGEPCVDALASVGILATTSSGGASNADRTDWSPLAGR